MAATNRYLSLSLFDQFSDQVAGSNVITEGSSSTAADYVELRMLITKADGTTATKLTVQQVRLALKAFERYLHKRGRSNLGAATDSLPLPGPAMPS